MSVEFVSNKKSHIAYYYVRLAYVAKATRSKPFCGSTRVSEIQLNQYLLIA